MPVQATDSLPPSPANPSASSVSASMQVPSQNAFGQALAARVFHFRKLFSKVQLWTARKITTLLSRALGLIIAGAWFHQLEQRFPELRNPVH